MDNWYEEMERAEQEYDAHQQDMADVYKSGYNAGLVDGETMACSEGALRGAYEQGKEEGIAKGRADAIDEFARKIKPYIAEYRSAIEHNRYAFIDVDYIAEKLKSQK